MTGPFWFSDRAVFAPADGTGQALALAGHLQSVLPYARVRPGLAGVLVDIPHHDPELLGAVLRAGTPDRLSTTTPHTRDHRLHVRYTGEDLHEAARTLGWTPAQLIDAHTSERWTVAMIGFAPGFGYLLPDHPERWRQLGRRATPRTSVPAGSVALAAGMSAIYPQSLPGGWNLIGQTDEPLFAVDAPDGTDPCLLHPGDTVAFVPESRS